jgi:hypothetical protein
MLQSRPCRADARRNSVGACVPTPERWNEQIIMPLPAILAQRANDQDEPLPGRLEVKPKSAVTTFAIIAFLGLVPGCTPLAKDQPRTSQSRPPSAFRDRHEFAKLLSSIKSGMTDADVIRILGKPDDIRTPLEMTCSPGDLNEAWCFGTDGGVGFPTLGTIWFESRPAGKTVIIINGAEGTPPPPSLFDEGELRRLLSMLGHDGGDPSPGGLIWDPSWGIKAANTLAPLGKRKALAAIEEYLRVSHLFPYYEMTRLMRVLFDVPKDTGYMPESPFRSWDERPPTDRKRIPRFPMLIIGDVPLQIADVTPTMKTGPYPDYAKDIAWFRDHATIRTKPLQPTDEPLQLFSEWKTYDWLYRDIKTSNSWGNDYIESCVKAQLRRLLRTVYRGDIEKGSLSEPVRWDMKRNMYTFLDGKILPGSLEQHKSELK